MKKLFISLVVILMLLSFSNPVNARQIHKCVGQGGSISYQDSPCVKSGETMLEKKGIVDATTYQESLRAISGKLGDKEISMLSFNWWKSFKKEFSEKILHFKFTDDEGDTPISLLIDFIVPQSDKFITDKEIRSFMSQKTELFFKTSVETSLNLEKLKLKDGFGYYQTFTDKNLVGKKSYPPGEYLYTTSGVMVMEDIMINFTLLSNSYTAQNHTSALGFLMRGIFIEVGENTPTQPTDLTYLEQGLVAFLGDKVVDSVELFRLSTIEEPEKYNTWMAYCLALREVNRLQSAYIACDKAISLNPDDLDLEHRLLNLMIIARDFNNALNLSAELIEKSQSEAITDTIINLGFFAMSDGQLDFAQSAFKLLESKGISSMKLTNDLAVLAYLRGDKLQALDLIEGLNGQSDDTDLYVSYFKNQVEMGESLHPPFHNEVPYVLIPQRLKNLGSGTLVNQQVDPWVTHKFPVKGVGLLQVKLPEDWVAMPQWTEQDSDNSILDLKLFDPNEMTKMIAVDVGKVSTEWTLEDLEQQMRSSLKVFFKDEKLEFDPLSGDQKGYQHIKTLRKEEVSVRVLHKELLNGLVGLGINATEINADEKTEAMVNQVFNGIELLETDQTPLLYVPNNAKPADEDVSEVQQEVDNIELPEPPAGFTWVRMPKAKASFLKPDGWFEINKSTKDAITYALSKEQITETEQFETGLTMIAAKDIAAKVKMSPYRYALDMILGIESDSDNTVIKQGSKKQGPFDSLFIKYENNPSDLKPIIIHKMFIANEKTGSLYIVIFEAPKDEWDDAWKVGEVMLKKYSVDDAF